MDSAEECIACLATYDDRACGFYPFDPQGLSAFEAPRSDGFSAPALFERFPDRNQLGVALENGGR